jgi:uncharacterized protein (TIGR03083 family)
MDLRSLYAGAQARAIAVVTALPPDGLATAVPATPGWTVHDLVCHLCGVAADLSSGNVEGAATPPWTARHLAERRGRPLGDLVVEWQERSEPLLDMLATPGRVDAAAFDILTHEHDLRGSLGMAGPSDPEAVEVVVARVAQRFGRMVDGSDLPAVRLVGDGVELVCGSGDVAMTGTASTVEWFRALMGRRSAGQVRTYHWQGDPTPYFPLMSLFGALPEMPVREAGAPSP